MPEKQENSIENTMGITDVIYFQYCKPYFQKATSILELGAQFFLVNGKSVGYFKNLMKYPIDSIDLTGENNSLKYNLSTPLVLEKQYQLITNFGTSEHVANQYECWKNIHSACILGGFVINEVPQKGSWKNHCKFYVEESFFRALSKEFEIVLLKPIFYRGQGNNLFCILRKKNDTWTLTKEEFMKNIYIDTTFEDKQSF